MGIIQLNRERKKKNIEKEKLLLFADMINSLGNLRQLNTIRNKKTCQSAPCECLHEVLGTRHDPSIHISYFLADFIFYYIPPDLFSILIL